MKKLLCFCAMLLLSMYVCISYATAAPVTYSATGTLDFSGAIDDPYNWDGEEINILYTIESSKSPFYSDGDLILGITSWLPDSVQILIGGTDYSASLTEASLSHEKYLSYNLDRVTVFTYFDIGLDHVVFSWEAQYDYCYLGDVFPYPLKQNIDITDANFARAGALINLETGQFVDNIEIDGATIGAATGPVPEPTTMLLFGAGLVGLAGFGRKRFKK